jgi:hypothetical protein
MQSGVLGVFLQKNIYNRGTFGFGDWPSFLTLRHMVHDYFDDNSFRETA